MPLKKRQRTKIILLAIMALFFITATKNYIWRAQLPKDRIVDPGVVEPRKLLIIAPHPDDEALGTGGIIADAVKSGDEVKVVIVTSGESFARAAKALIGHPFLKPKDYLYLGKIRHEESRAAMKILGVSSNDVIFLGYADGSLRFLWDSYWDYEHPRLSGGTMVDHAPYDDVYKPQAPYNGQSLVDELAEIIEEYKPTDIYYPSCADEHPDHWATGAFVEYTLKYLNYKTNQHAYLIHHRLWPSVWIEDKKAPEIPPSDMKGDKFHWESITLSKGAIDAKSLAIKQYKSQMDIMAPFLYAFVRNTEIFIEPHIDDLPGYTVENDPLKYLTSNQFLLINDPPGINLRAHILPSSDLLQLNGLLDNNMLWLALKVDKSISSHLLYEIHLRLFYTTNIKRLDILYHGGIWQTEDKAKNSIILNNIQGGVYQKQWLYAGIPLVPLPKYIYLNADVSTKDKLIDRLPLCMFKTVP